MAKIKTISERADIGQLTVHGIVNEVKQSQLKKASKEKIAELKQNIAKATALNKEITKKISSLKSKLNATKKYTHYEKLKIDDELSRLESGKKVEFEYGGKTFTGQKKSVYSMKNQLKKAEGKDFDYVISDGFNEPYKVKRSKIIKMQDNSFFINKMKTGIEAKIKEYKKSKNPEDLKKIKILEQKLLPVIEFNSKIDKYSKEDLTKLKKEIGKREVEEMIDAFEEEEKTGKYPIGVDIFGEIISIGS